MARWTLTKTRLVDGIYEGILAGTGTPRLAAHHAGGTIAAPEIEDGGAGVWHLRLRMPPEVISDGGSVVVISDADSGETLDSIAILAGDPLDEDLRAEVALLRAELDLLKRAFRRHCTGEE